MPRRSRVQLNGTPLHIVQRGHNREPRFFAEEDYLSYLYWLSEALAANWCQLHAYVHMTSGRAIAVSTTRLHVSRVNGEKQSLAEGQG